MYTHTHTHTHTHTVQLKLTQAYKLYSPVKIQKNKTKNTPPTPQKTEAGLRHIQERRRMEVEGSKGLKDQRRKRR